MCAHFSSSWRRRRGAAEATLLLGWSGGFLWPVPRELDCHYCLLYRLRRKLTGSWRWSGNDDVVDKLVWVVGADRDQLLLLLSLGVLVHSGGRRPKICIVGNYREELILGESTEAQARLTLEAAGCKTKVMPLQRSSWAPELLLIPVFQPPSSRHRRRINQRRSAYCCLFTPRRRYNWKKMDVSIHTQTVWECRSKYSLYLHIGQTYIFWEGLKYSQGGSWDNWNLQIWLKSFSCLKRVKCFGQKEMRWFFLPKNGWSSRKHAVLGSLFTT